MSPPYRRIDHNKLFFFFSVFIMVLLLFSPVFPQGDTFETATEMSFGNKYTGSLPKATTKYYKINLSPGQELNIDLDSSTDAQHGANFYVRLLDSNKKELRMFSGLPYSDSPETGKITWLAGTTQPSETYYVKVNTLTVVGGTSVSYSLDVSVVSKYDLTSQTDAGDTFDNALDITSDYHEKCCWVAKEYSSFVGADLGDDVKDVYKIDLKKRDNLTATITPEEEGSDYPSLNVILYDGMKKAIDWDTYGGEGEIIKKNYMSKEDQTIYIEISRGSQGGPYSINLEVEAVPAICTPEDRKCSENNEILKCDDLGIEWKIVYYCSHGCEEEGNTASCVIPPDVIPDDIGDLYGGSGFGDQIDDVGITGGLGVLSLFLGTMSLFFILPIIGIYVYFALALSTIAKKTNTSNAWFAWVPILNFILMAKIAKMSLWTVLLMLIPIVNIVIMVIWWMKIAERRGKPSWLGILMLLPIANLVIPGILAWSNGNKNKPEDILTIKPTGSQSPQQNTMMINQDQEKLDKMITYIKQNLAQGYDINSIRNSLIEQGFDVNLVDKAIQIS